MWMTKKKVGLEERDMVVQDRETEMKVEENRRVCVTGAGGYQASWLVKLLLSKGYMVHGTVRDPSDEKNAHLMRLEKASENLRLLKADLLDYDSLYAAIEGCSGVFHVATPVPLGNMVEEEIMDPAVKGTSNVLKASSAANVKKVVYVSSISAIIFNPDWPKDEIMDESCWSNKGFCKDTQNWYGLAKTEAESMVLDYEKKSQLRTVSVCPSVIIGPMLQSSMNASSIYLQMILKDKVDMAKNKYKMFVDVRDTAEALLLVYEMAEAEGRYLCSSCTLRDLIDMFKIAYPNNKNYPNPITVPDEDMKLSSEKLKKLGWSYRPIEDTLVDTVESYGNNGILDEM